tara:strand:+ start:7 stop:459 length:453 start_codon:yes stop_codon:yes gene_type:complete
MNTTEPVKIISTNKKATFQYFLLEKFEAGIQLLGSEVKSIREGNVNIKEAYVKFNKNELYLVGMHIGEYSHSGYSTHDPLREKKLLLHKNEINKIIKNVSIKGTTVIPVRLYIKTGKIKVEIAISKGKKIWDKRESKKNKDIQRNIERHK